MQGGARPRDKVQGRGNSFFIVGGKLWKSDPVCQVWA